MANADSNRASRASKRQPLNIDHEVALMERMTVTELKRKFEDVFEEECRSGHKRWLIKRIAWRLQANEEGDLSERARKRAMELANDADLRLKAPKPKEEETKPSTEDAPFSDDPRIPVPGTVLERVYKGRQLEVKVRRNGFEYEGLLYKSLSAVAKAITGSHTNGFLFFRLTDDRRPQ